MKKLLVLKKCYIKYAFLLVGVLFIFNSISFQELPTILPPSSNTASLSAYNQIPVGKFTGTIQTSIPLYTFSTGKLNLPISLSYHASGIKTNQGAIKVGSDWNLNNVAIITIPPTTISSLEPYSNLNLDKLSKRDLIMQLNSLHSQFPNDLIITYTYDSLISVTSITDTHEETMYYEFDAFNRLEYVKDF